MNFRVDVLDAKTDRERLRRAWDQLVRTDCETVKGHDGTSSFAWFEALTLAMPAASTSRVVVVLDGDNVVAMLPVARHAGAKRCVRLFTPTMLYGGRNGLLLRDPNPSMVVALLDGLRQAFGAWRSLRLSLVEGSQTERLLSQACAGTSYRLLDDSERMPSPYFPLCARPEDFAAGMSKSLRQTLRTATNKLHRLGGLEYVELSDAGGTEDAIEAILKIERSSWKHEAGTAITCRPDQERFYRTLFPLAARSGLLYGLIGRLNGQPVAFNFGLVQGSVFCCLKHSQTTEYEGLSPGQVLNSELLDRLRLRGVRTYDFMGRPETHKLRWSDQTALYTVRDAWVFGQGPCGFAGYAIHRAKRITKEAWALLGSRQRATPVPMSQDEGGSPPRTN
ncbi:GNAT family N-acetyltransferase [Piscinibacter defluvii]|uniref:GNAT family N-acetyltransferase n=1 Tax=Piscinibacter defluvii TaxID=1796922 RepID=UPI0013E30263|nr:GNAT family N-acetyltransferase [Piscinibacter defluvii]